MTALLPILGLALLAAWLAPRAGRTVAHLAAWVAHPAFAALPGLVTALAVAAVAGGLDMPGAYHDERAYLVQARLLAGFTWAAPAPPVPSAWEMVHVFVAPALFAKYPPGFAPLLVPGVWLGAEGLGPVVLAGLAAALLFALVRRVADPWTALLAWALWTSAPTTLRWQATYLSETATAPLWLGALLLLHRWVTEERAWQLATLVALVAWIGIARPVTGLALALPIGAVLARVAWRRRRLAGWRTACLAGGAACALVPYWTWRTTGGLREVPYVAYSRVYFPFDLPGFTRDASPPKRPLPPDYEALADEARRLYRDHVPARALANARERAITVARASLDPRRALPLLLLVPLGALAAGAAVTGVLLASAALQLGAYLLMPHDRAWTVYYLELAPVLPALAALGARQLAAWLRRAVGGDARRSLPGVASLAVATTLVVLWRFPAECGRLAASRRVMTARPARLRTLVAALPDPRVVVFVRRAPAASPHFAVHDILGAPATTPTWIVRDVGPAGNAALLAAAGGRRPYVLDETTMTLRAGPPG